MIPRADANGFANVMGIDLHIARQEVVLLYALNALSTQGVLDRLVFKGGTYARMMVTGDTGRLSEDLDFTNRGLPNDPQELLEDAFRLPILESSSKLWSRTRPSSGIGHAVWGMRTSGISASFDSRFSYREATFMPPRRWRPLPQPYFGALPFPVPELPCLQREEAIAEKLRAVQQRATERDLYDAARYGKKGFDQELSSIVGRGKTLE